ncbi:MAG: hypothetical protein K2J82_01630 [Muribaculaceae bacterium]|nr:hypothetical protein [Muribaculaceae bacterium]
MNNSYKRLDRKSNSTLEDAHIKFFHKLIVSIENNKKIKDKIIKNFSHSEVKNIINNEDNDYFILINPIEYSDCLVNDEIRFTNHKRNKAYSLLCHLRNAFAHNRIQVEDGSGQLIFQDEYNKIINMVGKCSFQKLKYLVETILGEQKMTQGEIQEYKKKNKRKRKQSKQNN